LAALYIIEGESKLHAIAAVIGLEERCEHGRQDIVSIGAR
jgi:hypothetical protein